MRFTLKQMQQGFPKLFEIDDERNNIIALAKQPDGYQYGEPFLYLAEGEQPLNLFYVKNQKRGLFKKIFSKYPFLPFKIVGRESDQQIGYFSVYTCKTRNPFLKYDYIHLYYLSEEYDIYYVGMGLQGHKFPIYKDGKQIGLIEKNCIIYDGMDEYQMYFLNKFDKHLISMIALYIDAMFFTNWGNYPLTYYSNILKRTTNKKLRTKYDPYFISNT